MTRRHQIIAAVVAGPLLGLSGTVVTAAAGQTGVQRPVKVSEQASAQHARIGGTIKDDSGAAVEGALVSALGFTSGLAVTDAAGRFSIALPPGEYQIRVHRDGYASNFREVLLLRAHASVTRAIVLQRTGERAVMTAGFGASPSLPEASTAPRTHPHTEQAWRLRHLKRPVLRDGTVVADAFEGDDGNAWTSFGRAFGAPARLASAIFSDLPIDGELRFVSAGSIGPYAPGFAELSAAGVAYLSVRAPVGSHGEWSARGTMSSADLGTWLVAGDYVAKPSNTHAFNLGMSFGSQGMPAGDDAPVTVAAVFTDGTRNAGRLHAFDRWRMSPVLLIDYGTRIDYFDYLPGETMLWSPVVSLELTPWGEGSGTSITVSASSRRDAPGSAEFTPPPAGPWLPPQRMFAALPGVAFEVERTDHAEIELEHRFDGAYTVGLRRFAQRTGNQIATLFSLDRPGLLADGAYYYVTAVGDAAVDGWSVGLRSPDDQPVRASVEYALADVTWTPAAGGFPLVGAAARDGVERVHDVTASFGADVPQTKTRLAVLYRISSGYATIDHGPAPGARFDMQLNQGLPFVPRTAGQWEVLLSLKNTLRDQRFGMSMLDELLAVSTPTRVVGGVQVKF